MATRLKNIVRFANVAPGDTVSLPHDIRGANDAPAVPDHVEADSAGFSVSVNSVDVTVTNNNPGVASIGVLCELWHTIERAFGPASELELIPRPFIVTPAGSGGGNPINVEEEGVLVGVRPTLNFIGPGVTAADDAPNNRVNVTTATAAPVATAQANAPGVADSLSRSDHVHRTIVQVQDDAVLIASRPTLNFTGAGVTVADDVPGDRATVNIPGGAQSCVLGFGSGNVSAAADTRFLSPWFDAIGSAATGTIVDVVAPRAGTLRNLFVRHNRALGNGQPVVYTVLVNGVATLLAVTLVTGAIGQQSDLVNAVAVAQGDRIALQAVKALSIGDGGVVAIATVELA